MFLTAGGITIDGVQFNTDPETYEPLNWEKRYSKFPAISGVMTIQDFGVFKRDNTLRLQSGNTRPLEQATVSALHTRFRQRGVVFLLTDWLGNEYQVFIEKFVPVPLKKGRDNTPSGGTVSLYTYTMDLHVLQINQLFGAAFVGP